MSPFAGKGNLATEVFTVEGAGEAGISPALPSGATQKRAIKEGTQERRSQMVSVSVCPWSRVTIRDRSRRWRCRVKKGLSLALHMYGWMREALTAGSKSLWQGPLTWGRRGRTQACPCPGNSGSVTGE